VVVKDRYMMMTRGRGRGVVMAVVVVSVRRRIWECMAHQVEEGQRYKTVVEKRRRRRVAVTQHRQ